VHQAVILYVHISRQRCCCTSTATAAAAVAAAATGGLSAVYAPAAAIQCSAAVDSSADKPQAYTTVIALPCPTEVLAEVLPQLIFELITPTNPVGSVWLLCAVLSATRFPALISLLIPGLRWRRTPASTLRNMCRYA
jgi:hypothetical protein